MYRPAARTIVRATTRATSTSSLVSRQPVPRQLGLRTLTTAPPHKTSRSWKNGLLRWIAAGGIVYWYNTTDVFAEEPTNDEANFWLWIDYNHPPEPHHDPEPLPTIDSLAAQRKEREALAKKAVYAAVEDAPMSSGPLGEGGVAVVSPEQFEEEVEQQGAFNEETGEINWDCPCLGGMADGPCGPDFKEAFSCFVFSKEEPKGLDCIDKFKHMQDCFRAHPDIYGAELEDDEEDIQGEGGSKAPVAASAEEASPLPVPVSQSEQAPAPAPAAQRREPAPAAKNEESAPAAKREDPSPSSKTEKAKAATEQVKRDHEPTSESERLVPRAAHDAR
ncbi:hypothetical protein FKW77_004154 [Venturia effusa]|uniref:Mitochondrial intermembrane space import and assembly protein 40 n=1 Tax=Venturia effusa TaxID=50376 RepID=A0A517L571_9PEZI|nr:hypothetical protein FKW77_004154 [Venturia effusa]